MTPSVCRNMSELGKITIVQSISKSAHIMVHWIIKMEVKVTKYLPRSRSGRCSQQADVQRDTHRTILLPGVRHHQNIYFSI